MKGESKNGRKILNIYSILSISYINFLIVENLWVEKIVHMLLILRRKRMRYEMD